MLSHNVRVYVISKLIIQNISCTYFIVGTFTITAYSHDIVKWSRNAKLQLYRLKKKKKTYKKNKCNYESFNRFRNRRIKYETLKHITTRISKHIHYA